MDKKVIAVKVLGLVGTIGGLLASNWVGKKETESTLAKLVEEKLKNK